MSLETVLTDEHIRRQLEDLNLSDADLRILQQALEETQESGLSKTIQDLTEEDWIEEPVTGKEFLENPYYFGELSESFYEGVKQDFIDIVDRPLPALEVVLTGALRWGKSYLVALIIAWHLYRLGCMRNPQEWLGLSPVSSIFIINLSVTGAQAREGIFADLRNMVDASPWFGSNFQRDKRLTEVLRFPRNIICKSGNSSEFSAIGKNVYIGVVDESNFFGVKKKSARSINASGEYDAAKTLYEALIKRIRLTYTKGGIQQGLGILSSSARYPQDYIERKIRFLRKMIEDGDFDGTTVVKSHAVWDVTPEKFVKKPFKVEIGDKSRRSRILETKEDEKSVVGEVIEIPGELKTFFLEDIENALRDLAGRSTASISPFFRRREKIKECFSMVTKDKYYKHPMDVDVSLDLTEPLNLDLICVTNPYGKLTPRYNPSAPRGIALDLAKAKDTGDPLGIAVVHVAGYKKVQVLDLLSLKEEVITKPIFKVDFVGRVRGGDAGEITHGNVIKFIIKLRLYGFPISFVTADQYQSTAILQAVAKKNIDAFVKSAKAKEFKPYTTFKDAVYENRFICYPYPPLESEMSELENFLGKIDHPPNGHNDICDALACCMDELSIRFFDVDDKGVPIRAALDDNVYSPEADLMGINEFGARSINEDPLLEDIDSTLIKSVDHFVLQGIPLTWNKFNKEERAITVWLLKRKAQDLGSINRYGQAEKCLQEARANELKL